jgi:hypothetical protein
MHESEVPRTNPDALPPATPAPNLTDSVAGLRLGGEQAGLAMNLLTPRPQDEMNESARRLVQLAREQALGSRAGRASDFVPIVRDSGNLADAWAQFALFHMQSALERELAPSAPLPRLDFQQRVALLSDYPQLLRKLGLIVDLTFAASLLSGAKGEIEVRFKRAPDTGFQRTQPRTRFSASAGRFEAASKGGEIVNGMLNLANHEVIGFDLDGAGLQVVAGLRDPNRESRPPSLRSTGLSLVRAKRAEQMHRSVAEVFALLQEPESGASPVLFAEDLVRGYRVDIFETRNGRWRSLHQRIGKYTFTSTGAEDRISDEGAVMPNIAQPARSDQAIAEATHDPEQPGFVAESVFLWNGWSLSAARPVVAMTELTLPKPSSPVASVPLTVSFEAEPRSLPRLRFGDAYRVRLRIADLAGNGVPPPTKSDPGPTGPAVVLPPNSEGWRFLRCEPVGPPVVQRPGEEEDHDAASIDALVLKSGHEDNAAVTFAAEVRITPPLVSQVMAEQMGAFDQSIGTGNNLDRTFRIAAGEAPDDDVRRHRDTRNGALPDPMAIGIAIHNCPGLAEGQLSTFDSEGVLHSSSLTVPDTVRPGVKSVLLIPFVAAPEWPSIDGILLRLRDGDRRPEWDPSQRILTVFLPPAVEREIQVACNLDDAGLDRIAILNWTGERLDEKVKAGQLSPEAARDEISALRHAGNAGLFRMITPVHKLRLIHAVREPLRAPDISNFAPLFRLVGDTKVFVGCEAAFDPASTSRLELRASWEDHDDAANLPSPRLISRTASVLTVDLAAAAESQPRGVTVDHERGAVIVEPHPLPAIETSIQQKIAKVVAAQRRLRDAGAPDDQASDGTFITVAGREPLQPHWAELQKVCETVADVAKEHMFDPSNPADTPFDREATAVNKAALALKQSVGAAMSHLAAPHPGHDPGDPKHRNITYQWHAVSRFAAHYGSKSDDAELRFVKSGTPVTASAPSSAQPAPPKIIRVVPSFEWVRETSPAGVRIHERRAGLRVYLERPWFSSGDGELLAVVVGFGIPAPPSIQRGTITRWARDPAWITGGLPPDPGVDHFRNFAIRKENDIRPILLGYEVQHDSHGRCFCDIDMELPRSYAPFVKLALASLQPNSIKGLALSEVVIADPAPLLPRRKITATPQSDGSLVVEISGTTHRSVSTLKGSTGTIFGAVLQRQFAPASGDLGWEDADDVGSIEIDGTPSPEFLWRAVVRVDTPEPNLRLLIGEAEIFSSPDLLEPSSVARGVFAETLLL